MYKNQKQTLLIPEDLFLKELAKCCAQLHSCLCFLELLKSLLALTMFWSCWTPWCHSQKEMTVSSSHTWTPFTCLALNINTSWIHKVKEANSYQPGNKLLEFYIFFTMFYKLWSMVKSWILMKCHVMFWPRCTLQKVHLSFQMPISFCCKLSKRDKVWQLSFLLR